MKNRLLCLALLSLLSPSAHAVPVPWKNCGAAGDIISIALLDASSWPPKDFIFPPFPFSVTVALNAANGDVRELRTRFMGPDVEYVSHGPIAGGAFEGFIDLPDSVSMRQSDQTPGKAGPFNRLLTIGTFSEVIKGAVGVGFTDATANLSLTFNGTPGFPIRPVFGIYQIEFQARTDAGKEISCMQFTIPGKVDVSIDRVPLGDLSSVRADHYRKLVWDYGEFYILKSGAMDPQILFRRCGENGSDDRIAAGRFGWPRYDRAQRAWTFAWDTDALESGCYELSIRSRLTGQVDGPFVEIIR